MEQILFPTPEFWCAPTGGNMELWAGGGLNAAIGRRLSGMFVEYDTLNTMQFNSVLNCIVLYCIISSSCAAGHNNAVVC